MVEFFCSNCGARLRTSASSHGKTLVCPKCNANVTVPEPPQGEGAAPSAEVVVPGQGTRPDAQVGLVGGPERTVWKGHPAMFRNHPILFLVSVLLILAYGIGLLILLIWWLDCLGTTLSVTSRRTVLRHGLISKRTREIRHSDVRLVEADQGILDRLFGVGRIGVSSAGTGGVEIAVSGIVNPQSVASLIRDLQEGREPADLIRRRRAPVAAPSGYRSDRASEHGETTADRRALRVVAVCFALGLGIFVLYVFASSMPCIGSVLGLALGGLLFGVGEFPKVRSRASAILSHQPYSKVPARVWVVGAAGCAVLLIGASAIGFANDFRIKRRQAEQAEAKRKADEEQRRLVASENARINSLLRTAERWIETRQPKGALEPLKAAVGLGYASTGRDEARALLRQCQEALSDKRLRRVILAMSEAEFAAFQKQGEVPKAAHLSNPHLDAFFAAKLMTKKAESAKIREDERPRIEAARPPEEETKRRQGGSDERAQSPQEAAPPRHEPAPKPGPQVGHSLPEDPWGKLHSGMSSELAMETLGPPQQVSRAEGGNRKILMWRYDHGGQIVFQNGKLTQFEKPKPDAPTIEELKEQAAVARRERKALAARSEARRKWAKSRAKEQTKRKNQRRRAAWGKIKQGLTREEVKKLLGEPHREEIHKFGSAGWNQWWYYEAHSFILFNWGKVRSFVPPLQF